MRQCYFNSLDGCPPYYQERHMARHRQHPLDRHAQSLFCISARNSARLTDQRSSIRPIARLLSTAVIFCPLSTSRSNRRLVVALTFIFLGLKSTFSQILFLRSLSLSSGLISLQMVECLVSWNLWQLQLELPPPVSIS